MNRRAVDVVIVFDRVFDDERREFSVRVVLGACCPLTVETVALLDLISHVFLFIVSGSHPSVR